MAEARKQVAKKAPARKAAKATPAPAKKAAAAKVTPAKSTTRSRGTARTAVSPAAVEEAAVEQAAPARRRRGPDPDRPAARAARAMRGEPEPVAAAEPGDDDAAVAAFAAQVDARLDTLREEARAETADTAAEEHVLIPFQGRHLLVQLPSEEQLTMYRRVSREFAALAASGRAEQMPIEEALKYLDRAVRTVQSVLVSDDDREWIEDQLMDRKLKLGDCLALMRESFRRLAEKHGNRETRRAAGRQTAAALED